MCFTVPIITGNTPSAPPPQMQADKRLTGKRTGRRLEDAVGAGDGLEDDGGDLRRPLVQDLLPQHRQRPGERGSPCGRGYGPPPNTHTHTRGGPGATGISNNMPEYEMPNAEKTGTASFESKGFYRTVTHEFHSGVASGVVRK